LGPIKRVAIFLLAIGVEKGQSVIALMDVGEIKAIVSEFQKLTVISQAVKASVMAEFTAAGYKENMRPSEVLTIIRRLFNGSKISNKGHRNGRLICNKWL
jgi:hypothetical protein